MSKICAKCKKELTLNMFGKSIKFKDGLNPVCKSCINKGAKERYNKNPEKFKIRQKKYTDNNSEIITTTMGKDKARF